MRESRLLTNIFLIIWYTWALFIGVITLIAILHLCISEKTVAYLIFFPLPICALKSVISNLSKLF